MQTTLECQTLLVICDIFVKSVQRSTWHLAVLLAPMATPALNRGERTSFTCCQGVKCLDACAMIPKVNPHPLDVDSLCMKHAPACECKGTRLLRATARHDRNKLWCCQGSLCHDKCKLEHYTERTHRSIRHNTGCPCAGKRRKADCPITGGSTCSAPARPMPAATENEASENSDDAFSDSDVDEKKLSALTVPRFQLTVPKVWVPNKGQINFGAAIYTEHAKFLPAVLATVRSELAEAYDVAPSKDLLFDSFLVFVLNMAACKGQLVQAHDWEQHVQAMSDDDKELWELMKTKMLTMPDMESFNRQRPKDSWRIYEKISKGTNNTLEFRLSLWIFFDMIFRYFGDTEAVNYFFWPDKVSSKELSRQLSMFQLNLIDADELSSYLCARVQNIVY